MLKIFNLLDVAIKKSSTAQSNNTILLLTLLILIIIGGTIGGIIVKSKATKNNKNNFKPKEIPLKKTSIIDDPATVRMTIEEQKINTDNNDIINQNNKKEKNTVHIDDNKMDDDII